MSTPGPSRDIFCNRTLNLHGIRAIGYDMDYTLIHYYVEIWERRAYGYLRAGLQEAGWPVEALEFEPDRVTRGLIIDLDLGNIVKANRFGYVKRATHGSRALPYPELRRAYARTRIDLREDRWVFLNTLFSLSEGCMYLQLVDAFEARRLPVGVSYRSIYHTIRRLLHAVHTEGRLKADIVAEPTRFVDLDPDTPLALLDQKDAGKKILLITNSEWAYAAPMMSYAFDRFLPSGMTWRDLFDITLVAARKPLFFSVPMPLFELVDERGLLRESSGPLKTGRQYVGGNAALVEESLGLSGEEILYVGDHLFVDVNVSKSIFRWRTALVLRELEAEIAATEAFAADQATLTSLMNQKSALEQKLAHIRLHHSRLQHGRAPQGAPEPGDEERIHAQIARLDHQIVPLARRGAQLSSAQWGLLMRAGNDKSHLARQVQRYADVYTSRVSNFRLATPFAYLRSPRGSLPHSRG